MTETEIEELLAEAVAAYRLLPTDLPVGTVIEAMTGCRVIPVEPAGADSNLVNRLALAAEHLIASSKTTPIKTGRVNELGNNIEEPLLNACVHAGLVASWPRRSDGSGGRSGYPDIAISIDGRKSFLEAKVIASGSEGSTFRSFYLSPSDNPKVSEDARHILIAFTHKRVENSPDGLEQYQLTSYKIVDLALVCGKIKFEYQSNNRDMYLGAAVLAKG
jgi:hypothetical protein